MNRKYDAVIFDLFGTLIDDLTYPKSQMDKYRRVTFEMASALGVATDGFERVWMETGDRRMAGQYSDLGASLEANCRELG